MAVETYAAELAKLGLQLQHSKSAAIHGTVLTPAGGTAGSYAKAAAACELGPNGALVYCIEFLEANLDWLIDALERLKDCYVLIDMPGQVELYTHHYSVRNMLQKLTTNCNHRLTAVHLVDAHHCSDPAKFIAVLLVTLSTMVQLELP